LQDKNILGGNEYMGKLHFSQSKFSKFLNGKGFYIALAVCLIGAGTASWAAVNKTMSDLENVGKNDTSTPYTQSEEVWQSTSTEQETLTGTTEESSQTTEETGTQVSQVPAQPSSSAVSSSSSPSEPSDSSNSEESQEASTKPVPSSVLRYILPVSGEFLNDYSQGELVKSKTLGDWRTHDGIDIAAEAGTPVMASADGTVVSAYNDGLWGTVVIIEHADGCQSVYAALDTDITVSKGDVVARGETIGYVGLADAESEELSHLHFGIRRDRVYTDPMDFITDVERPE
jgi:murein DD-endopeptidase MepM/ murein hydrolase activator NlpD